MFNGGAEFRALFDVPGLAEEIESGGADVSIAIVEAGDNGVEHGGVGKKVGRMIERLLAGEIGLILRQRTT